jgi:hypothetical protein
LLVWEQLHFLAPIVQADFARVQMKTGGLELLPQDPQTLEALAAWKWGVVRVCFWLDANFARKNGSRVVAARSGVRDKAFKLS